MCVCVRVRMCVCMYMCVCVCAQYIATECNRSLHAIFNLRTLLGYLCTNSTCHREAEQLNLYGCTAMYQYSLTF